MNENIIPSINSQSRIFSKTWNAYTTWNIIFMAANLAAMTYVLTIDNQSVDSLLFQISDAGKFLLSFCWILFNIVGIVISFYMAWSSNKVRKTIIKYSRGVHGDFDSPFYRLGVIGGIFNGLVLAAFTFAWIFYGMI